MPIVVQKFGGTSVGSAEKIKNVARRVINTKKEGNDVVVIVSAMGHTTDELVSLLKQITSNPSPREYDMLLSTGEQVSAALLASALIEMGFDAVSLTGGQAGVITEDIPSKARIKAVKFDRIKKSSTPARSSSSQVSRGSTARANHDHRQGRIGYFGGGHRGGAQGRCLRDIH